jgi:hypothetical protein
MGRTNYPPVNAVYENVGPWRGHVREYTLPETVQVLRWSGFDVVRAETFHGMVSLRLRSPIARGMYKALCGAWGSLKDSLIVAARKPAGWRPREGDVDSARRSLGPSVPHAVR